MKHSFRNQAYAFGQAIGRMELYLKDGKTIAVRGRLIRDFSDITLDPEVQKMVDSIMARLDRDGLTTVLAHSSFHLNACRVGAKDEGGAVRMNETNLGDLVADGLLSIGKEMTDGKAAVALNIPAVPFGTAPPNNSISVTESFAVTFCQVPGQPLMDHGPIDCLPIFSSAQPPTDRMELSLSPLKDHLCIWYSMLK